MGHPEDRFSREEAHIREYRHVGLNMVHQFESFFNNKLYIEFCCVNFYFKANVVQQFINPFCTGNLLMGEQYTPR